MEMTAEQRKALRETCGIAQYHLDWAIAAFEDMKKYAKFDARALLAAEEHRKSAMEKALQLRTYVTTLERALDEEGLVNPVSS
jgi:hypothetical protein